MQRRSADPELGRDGARRQPSAFHRARRRPRRCTFRRADSVRRFALHVRRLAFHGQPRHGEGRTGLRRFRAHSSAKSGPRLPPCPGALAAWCADRLCVSLQARDFVVAPHPGSSLPGPHGRQPGHRVAPARTPTPEAGRRLHEAHPGPQMPAQLHHAASPTAASAPHHPPPARSPPPPPPPPVPPPPPPPPGDHPAVGAQFHCIWGFYYERRAHGRPRQARSPQASTGCGSTSPGTASRTRTRARGTRGTSDMVDFCVNQARARGMNVLITLWMTPGWANGNQGNLVPPRTPRTTRTSRAGRRLLERPRPAWEVWNEPDPAQSFWQGTTAQYVNLLRTAYPGFKAGEPEHAGRPRRPVVERRRLDPPGLRARRQGLLRRPRHPPVPGHRRRTAGAGRRRPPLVVHAPPRRPPGDDRLRRRREADLVHRVRLVGALELVGHPELGARGHAAAAGRLPVRSINYTAANYPYVPVMFWYKERAQPGGSDVHQEGYGFLNDDLSERPVLTMLRSYLLG